MQSLKTIKDKSQDRFHHLVELGKSQPQKIQAWGVTGSAAVVGALAVTVAAKGVSTIVAALASPSVALTVGAVAGGLAGWSLMPKGEARAEVAVRDADDDSIGVVADPAPANQAYEPST